jgi:hypothetical protein
MIKIISVWMGFVQMRLAIKKFAALLLIFVVLAAAGLCPCLESHAMEQSVACSHGGCDTVDEQGPACPADDHAPAGHDAASCFCACHLPVLVLLIQIQHVPVSGKLSPAETFTALPEVYLPKFIPPQNLA